MNYSVAEQKQIEKNIPKFAALMVVDKRVYGAILSLFFLSVNDVYEFHIGWILLWGAVTSFLFEIPSGYISDKIGHQKTIVLSRIFMIGSTLSYIFATNMYMLIAGGVLFNLAISCMSGTATAFMHDTLKALDREKDYSKVMGKAASIGYAIPTLFMAAASYLANYDLKYIFMVSLVIDAVGLFIALSLTPINYSKQYKQELKETKLKDVIKEGFKLGFMPYALIGAFIGGTLIGIRGYVDPFQQIAGADIALFGVFLGFSRLASSFVSLYSEQMKKYSTIYTFNVFRTIVFSALLISLGFVQNWQTIVIIMILINTINLGIHEVNKHYDLELINQSKFKATLISIKGQIHQVALAATTMGLGYAVTYYTYQVSFMSLGIVYFIFCSICLFYIFKKHKMCYNKQVEI